MDPFLIDGHKLIWHPDRIAQWMADQSVAPIYLEISPLSVCNHRCVFCGVDFAQQSPNRLDVDVYCGMLPEMRDTGVKSVMFAGEGEPLLHKSIERMVTETKSHGIDVAITTNGARGGRDFWGDILPSVSWVKFSVDAGSDDVYSEVHAVAPGVFGKTLETIAVASRTRQERRLDTKIGMQYLAVGQGIDDLRSSISIARELGVDYFVIKPYSLHPQQLNRPDVNYAVGDLEEIQALVDEQDTEQMPVIFRRRAMEQAVNPEIKYHHCYALPFSGYISSAGDFYTCPVFLNDERFRAGNIYETGFREIVHGTRRRRSVHFGRYELELKHECRVNCRLARVNEYLEPLADPPEHVNFI